MRQLSALQAIAEASSNSAPITKMLTKMESDVDAAYDVIKSIRDSLQSSALTEYLKAESFPATESKAAKTCAEAAFEAVRNLEREVSDLVRALSVD